MHTSTLIQCLKTTLSEQATPVVLASLRQDPLIWNSLQESTFAEKLCSQIIMDDEVQITDWCPGRLAFYALNHPYNRHDPLDGIQPSYLEQVEQSYPNLINDADALDLARAGMIALALSHRHQQTGEWSFLRSEIDQHSDFPWGTSLSCMLSITGDPQTMLKEIASQYPSALRSRLAIHTILSNPAETSERIDFLIAITHSPNSHFLSNPLELLDFLQILNDLNPGLAGAYCRKINALQNEETHLPASKPFHQTDILRETEYSLLNLEIARLAGDPGKVNLYLDKLSAMRNLFAASLLAQIAMLKPFDADDSLTSAHLVSNWKNALELLQSVQPASINEPFKAGLAHALIQTGQSVEAYAMLSNGRSILPENPYELLILLVTAHQAGNLELAEQAGLQLTEAFTTLQSTGEYIAPHAALNPEHIADHLSNLGMLNEAARVLEHGLNQAPYQERWLRKLIDILIAAKKFSHAAGNMQMLVGLHPDDLTLRRRLAHTFERYLNWSAALDEWVSLIENSHYSNQDEELADLHALAVCSINASQPVPAIHASQRAISLDSNDGLAYIYLGQAYSLQGDYERGLEFLTRATQQYATFPEGWLALADLFALQDQIKQAIESLQASIQFIPDNPQLLAKLGEYHLQAGNPTQAVNTLSQAVALSPKQIHYHYILGLALMNVGRSSEACEELHIAYQDDNTNIDYAHAYGATLLALGETENALQPLAVAIQSNASSNPMAYVDYAHAVMDLNNLGISSVSATAALNAVEHALAIDPSLSSAKAWRAEALCGTGDIEAAFSAYQEALETPLATDRFWRERLTYGVGYTAYQLGRNDIAIASAQEAISIAPHNAENYKLLAAAYLKSNLFEDSLRAARTVLNLNIDNLISLSWYADHITQLIEKNDELISPNLQSQTKQAIQEAQNALSQAIQLAPHRADMLVKLSKLQQMAGESASALATVNMVLNNEHATVQHLIAAADQYKSLGDLAGAVLCLEKAVTLDQSKNNPQSLDLFMRLAEAYTQKGDFNSASTTYEQAISLAPQLGNLYYERTNLLLKLGNTENAFACVETGISLARTDPVLPRLYILAAKMYRQNGDIASALGYIQKGMEVNQQVATSSPEGEAPLLLEDRLLIADLFRAVLQPLRAYQVLKNGSETGRLEDTAENDANLMWLGLKNELEQELGYSPASEIPPNMLVVSDNTPKVWLATLARMALYKGDIDKAHQYYHSARQALQGEDVSTATQVSLFEAALDFNEWVHAQEILRRMEDKAPNEPFTYLAKVSLIVMKAEFLNISNRMDVQRHSPGIESISPDEKEAFENALQQATNLIQLLEKNISSFDLSHPITRLERLNSRGQIALCSTPPNPETFSQLSTAIATLKLSTPSHPQSSEEAAAIIYATQMLNDWGHGDMLLAQVIQTTRPHSRNPWVWLHAALALETTDPREALSAARGALQLFPSKQIPSAVLNQALLARIAWELDDITIAQESIEAALFVWPDEAQWHLLAAKIQQEKPNQAERRKHLEQAANLEPTSMSIQLELGKAYLFDTNQVQSDLNKALQCLGTAAHLAPDEVSVWIWLAQAQLKANLIEQAVNSVQQIILLNPNNPEVAVLQAEIALKQKSYQVAHNYAQSAAQASPDDPNTTLLLAKTLKSLNRATEALQVLEAAIPISQDPLLLQYERVKLLHELQGANAALLVLSDLVTQYPDDPKILTSLARSQSDLGDLQAATHTAQAAIKAGKRGLESAELANIQYLAGSLLRKGGQLDQAIQHLIDAVNLAPDHLEAYLELGLARKERREYHQALMAFEQATKIAPHDPRPHYQAGLALKEGKDFRRSEAMLRQAANLAPNDVMVRRQLAQVVALNLVHNPNS